MKALKEKRISLRSLWRRGLVILSLFALVFASCGESDSAGDDSSGAGILRIKVLQGPQNDQYYGRPVDLEGAIIEVTYNNGNKEKLDVDNSGKFTAWPRIVTGFYYYDDDGDVAFKGMEGCIITYKNFFNYDQSAIKNSDSYAEFDGDIWCIEPYNTRNTWGSGPIPGVDEGLYDLGLHIVGRDRMAKKAYVDDDNFDLSGLEIEADYILPDTTQRDYKKINLADTSWRILPSYESNADGSSRGFLYITAGEDVYGFMNQADYRIAYYGGNNKGVTASVPLDNVYTVTGIDLASPPELEDYFYWQTNTSAKWIERLGDDAQLVVNYSGGAPSKKFYIKDLEKNRKIWYNANPGATGAGDSHTGAGWKYNEHDDMLPEALKYIRYDFFIVPIQYPLTVKANKDPGITLYYRGFTKKIPVDVFTTLSSISAVSKSGGEIIHNPGAARDNDKDMGEPGSGGLADLMEVTAIYQAYNNPSVQSKPLTLMYKGHLGQKLADADDYELEYIPYYTFSKSTTELGPENADASYTKGFEKWEKAIEKWEKGKGAETFQYAVTVGHKVDEWELYGINDLPEADHPNGGGLAYLYWDARDKEYYTAMYHFKNISGGPENFQWNLKPKYDKYDKKITYWRWLDRYIDYGEDPDDHGGVYPPLDGSFRDNASSGVKSKVKTDKPVVTWVVSAE